LIFDNLTPQSCDVRLQRRSARSIFEAKAAGLPVCLAR
jgi:hypothetical protein